jgi:hypothetical protein
MTNEQFIIILHGIRLVYELMEWEVLEVLGGLVGYETAQICQLK